MKAGFRVTIFPEKPTVGRGFAWHLKARNGRIIADAGGYNSRANARRAVKALPLDWTRVRLIEK